MRSFKNKITQQVKGVVSRWAYFCMQPRPDLLFAWCIVQYVYFIMLYGPLRRTPYSLRYRHLEVGGVTMYDKV